MSAEAKTVAYVLLCAFLTPGVLLAWTFLVDFYIRAYLEWRSKYYELRLQRERMEKWEKDNNWVDKSKEPTK
jgi:hypothetical protein